MVKTDGKDGKDEKKEKSPDNKTKPPPPEAQYISVSAEYLVLRSRIFSLRDSVALGSVWSQVSPKAETPWYNIARGRSNWKHMVV